MINIKIINPDSATILLRLNSAIFGDDKRSVGKDFIVLNQNCLIT